MCAALSPANFHLRNRILSEAAKHVRTVGFKNAALSAALVSLNDDTVNDRLLAHLFSRGFPIALVEYVVKSSNLAVQKELDRTFSKDAVVRDIESHMELFVQDRYKVPTGADVAEKALLTKIELLKPLSAHWPDAVALEYYPANVPYTVINLAEFVDTTAYYMERVETLAELLEPARRILQSKAMASRIALEEKNAADGASPSSILSGFLQGVPLSSGPHAGHSSMNPSWFYKRAQLAGLYGVATTSLLGDGSKNAADTRLLTRRAVKTFF